MTGRARAVNLRLGPYDVYVGRGRGPRGEPGMFGNPWSHAAGTLAQFRVASRAEAIAAYRRWLVDPSFAETLPKRRRAVLAALPSLRGCRLGCFCAPLPCHGDVLAELAEAGA